MSAIDALSTLVQLQTGHSWHSHPAAHWVMRHALTARLQRLRPEGERVFAPDELPTARLVAAGSDDPQTMGVSLEAVDFHKGPGASRIPGSPAQEGLAAPNSLALLPECFPSATFREARTA